MEQFYSEALSSEPTLVKQLERRVYGYVKMTEEEIIFKAYNFKKSMYEEKFKIPNAVKVLKEGKEAERKRKIETLKGALLGVADGFQKMVPNIQDYMEPDEKKSASRQRPQSASGERADKKGKQAKAK
jgi:hypothetical protein